MLSEPLQGYAFLAVAIIIALVLAKAGVRLVVRVTRKLELQGISPRLVEFSGALLRSLICLAVASFIIIEVLVTFGLREAVFESISSSLTANAGRIGVMVVIALAGYVVHLERIAGISQVAGDLRDLLEARKVEASGAHLHVLHAEAVVEPPGKCL